MLRHISFCVSQHLLMGVETRSNAEGNWPITFEDGIQSVIMRLYK